MEHILFTHFCSCFGSFKLRSNWLLTWCLFLIRKCHQREAGIPGDYAQKAKCENKLFNVKMCVVISVIFVAVKLFNISYRRKSSSAEVFNIHPKTTIPNSGLFMHLFSCCTVVFTVVNVYM